MKWKRDCECAPQSKSIYYIVVSLITALRVQMSTCWCVRVRKSLVSVQDPVYVMWIRYIHRAYQKRQCWPANWSVCAYVCVWFVTYGTSTTIWQGGQATAATAAAAATAIRRQADIDVCGANAPECTLPFHLGGTIAANRRTDCAAATYRTKIYACVISTTSVSVCVCVVPICVSAHYFSHHKTAPHLADGAALQSCNKYSARARVTHAYESKFICRTYTWTKYNKRSDNASAMRPADDEYCTLCAVLDRAFICVWIYRVW